ncbi:MAG: peptidylprolyl isomerase [Chloroflexota bacterium]
MLAPTVVFALVAVVAVGLLATGVVWNLNERDWAPVATVDGQVINRAQVRDREAVLGLLMEEQAKAVDSLREQNRVSAGEAAQLTDGLTASLTDVRSIAIASLIDDALVHRYATSEGVQVPPPDLATELATARSALTDRRMSYMRIAWQPGVAKEVSPETAVPDAAQLAELGSAVRAAIDSGTDRVALAEDYRSAGWFVTVDTRWLPSDGPVPWMDGEAVAAARAAPVGPLPAVVGVAWVAVLDIADTAPDPSVFGQQMLSNARDVRVSEGALQSWALAEAERSAVSADLLAKWAGTPALNVRAAEAVIGPADPQGPDGPWVELAHLVVADVPPAHIPAGEGTPGKRLVRHLAATEPSETASAFAALVAQANATTARSGELGYFVREQLRPELAALAFADGVDSGSVVGPIATENGEEIFLVRSTYEGALDERSIGALTELHRGTTSLFDMASSLSPAEAARAVAGPWRSAAEFEVPSAATTALFETPIGQLSGPFTIGEQLVVARILERRTDIPGPDALGRIEVDGFQTWLVSCRASATITYAPTAEPSPSAPPRGVPTPLGQPTPRLPVTPALP